MACGTGKTFTALRLAERVAEENGGKARILFLVPSISLLSQTLKEWTAQGRLDMRAFAVCSDSKVSKKAEDIAVYDLEVLYLRTVRRLRSALLLASALRASISSFLRTSPCQRSMRHSSRV